nr:corticotropin-releasing factor (CRF-DH) [Chilo suppressalis]
MMWWAVWCAVVAAGAGAASAPAPDSLAPLDLVQMDSPAPEDEGINYGVPPMGSRYASGAPWLYLLAEMPRESQASSGRVKRRMPSLSIDLPMSVLRQKLSLEKERKVQALRAAANRNFLNDIGKRGFQWVPSLEAGRYF